MKEVIFKKDGVYSKKFVEGEYVVKKEDSLIPLLDFCATIDNDVTFGDIFSLILSEKDEINKIFESSTYGYDIGAFQHELDQEELVIEDTWCNWDSFYVCLSWVAYHDKEDRMLVEYIDFGGKAKAISTEHDSEQEIGIAIEFNPINSYKNKPFRLDTSYKIGHGFLGEDILLETKKQFTVYDIISGILYEITFDGVPNGNDRIEWYKEIVNNP